MKREELIDKLLEWRPETRKQLEDMDTEKLVKLYNEGLEWEDMTIEAWEIV
jgi:hypothetical protein